MNLIERLISLPDPKETYLEILKIHNKEVPIANLLAYFFRNKETHGLKNLFIKALLKTNFYELDIKKEPNAKGTLISQIKPQKEQKEILNSISNVKVKTEFPTSANNTDSKRIDILIDTEKFVICIEFKINHTLNNPLGVYKDFINKKYKDSGKQLFYVVLTPTKKEADVSNPEKYLKDNKEFKQVILNHFIENVKSELPSNFEENKNFLYYEDFIQTIENREIKYKRRLFLYKLNEYLKSDYKHNNKGGYIQTKKNNYTLKIRIEGKKIQVEKWNKNKEKEIVQQLDLNTDLKEIARNISTY